MITANAQRFFSEYEIQLQKAVERYPDEYGVSDVKTVANRMRAAFIRQSYNKDGRAIRAVCRVLGIKHTYDSINTFLVSEE
jgi:hypothetical protein